MAFNLLLWDRIRELTRANRIFRQERIFQDQSTLDTLGRGAGYIDPHSQVSIIEQTNVQINRMQRYADYDQMDQSGSEISLALDLYADEISLVDPEYKHALIIRAENKRIKAELEELFYEILLIDRWLWPASRYLCKYGDAAFEIITDRNRTGVSSLKFMNIYNFTRIETLHGELVGFYFQDELEPQPIFMHPWSVAHFRLTSFENLFAPYGRAIIDPSRKPFKQLRLMEDAALVYRITRAPEKRIFTIPIGTIPPKDVPAYMQSIARQFKRQRFYNPTTGTFDEKYSPLIQEDDFFVPQRADGTGPTIDTLAGAENLDQIEDILYFKKKMVSPLKIPFDRVGLGESAGQPHDKSLSQSDADFAKAVKRIQSELSLVLTKIAIVHMALRGYPIESIKGFSLHLAATSALEDLYRMETWQTRAAVMAELKDLGYFPEEWIVTRFTDLSPDEIEDLKDADVRETGAGKGGVGGPIPDLSGGDEEFPAGEKPPGGEEGGPEASEKPGEEGDEGEDEDLGFEIPGEDEALEGYDNNREKKLLAEFAEFESRTTREYKVSSPIVESQFEYLVESGELDRLPHGKDDKILVESSVTDETCNEVKVEVANILKRIPQFPQMSVIEVSDLPT